MKEPFFEWLSWMRIIYQSLYHTWIMISKIKYGKKINFLTELRKRFPKTFNICCKCEEVCAKKIGILECFNKYEGTKKVNNFMKYMGIFGIYSRDLNTNSHLWKNSVSWCINNCFQGWLNKNDLEEKLSSISPTIRRAFEYDSRSVQGRLQGERGYGWKDGIKSYGLKKGNERITLPENSRQLRKVPLPTFSEDAFDKASTNNIYLKYKIKKIQN